MTLVGEPVPLSPNFVSVGVNIKHSSKSNSWGTPAAIIELARSVLGTIDLDPASDAQHNERVRATRIITAAEDGLHRAPWFPEQPGSVFLNPPGGKLGNQSLPVLFWRRLVDELLADRVTHAIFIGFSVELLQTAQGGFYCPQDFPHVVPNRRIAFVDPEGGKRQSPTHANVIVYVPGSIDNTAGFVRAFAQLGRVEVPHVGYRQAQLDGELAFETCA